MNTKRGKAAIKELERKLAMETRRANILAQEIWLNANTSRRREKLKLCIAEQNRLMSLIHTMS